MDSVGLSIMIRIKLIMDYYSDQMYYNFVQVSYSDMIIYRNMKYTLKYMKYTLIKLVQ